MKKFIKPLLIFLFVAVFVILNPWLYFRNCLNYKNFKIYSDLPLTEGAYSVLDEVEEMIAKSYFYDSELKIKIFVRADFTSYSWVPWQFPTNGYGQAIPILENIFISNADFETNKAYNSKGFSNGDSRVLAKLIAHEVTHVLIDHNSYKKWYPSLLKKYNWSDIGLLWKEEGYAEYIAMEWDDELAFDILNENIGNSNDLSVFGREYCTYWIAVKYLLESRHMTISEILDANIELKDVLSEIKNSLKAKKFLESNEVHMATQLSIKENLIALGKNTEGIRALMLTGSKASEGKSDGLSDYDVEVFSQ